MSIPLTLEGLATKGWISHTWRFVRELGIDICDDIMDFQPPRHNDQLLIPMFGNLGFRGQELNYLNQCRIFLQVLWLSELTTADGRYLERHAMLPPFSISCMRRYRFPNQGYPSTVAWSTWQRALKQLCICDQRFQLRYPLGPWADQTLIRWWYDATSQRLYDVSTTTIQEFQLRRRASTRSASKQFTPMGHASALPTHTQPATVNVQQCPRLTGLGLVQSCSPAVRDEFAWVIDNIQLPKNICDFIQKGHPLVVVSDGSFKQGHGGTAAWTIYFSDSCSCVGRVVVPGRPEDQSANRSELTGLYAIAASILFLERRFGFSGPVTVGCDGLSALQQVSKRTDFIDPTLPQYDLILATRMLVHQTATRQWKWQHVKGHQGDNTPIQNLDLLV
jgi:hypothetical protein